MLYDLMLYFCMLILLIILVASVFAIGFVLFEAADAIINLLKERYRK